MSTCVHRWVIETPNGPTGLSRCKLCGAEKTVFNAHRIERGGDESWADFALRGSTPKAG